MREYIFLGHFRYVITNYVYIEKCVAPLHFFFMVPMENYLKFRALNM